MMMYLAYPHEPILHNSTINYVRFLSLPDFTLIIAPNGINQDVNVIRSTTVNL